MQATRNLDPAHLQRASKVPDEMVGPYLDGIIMSLHQATDQWRFRKGSAEDVHLALDAFIALFTEAELRGMA